VVIPGPCPLELLEEPAAEVVWALDDETEEAYAAIMRLLLIASRIVSGVISIVLSHLSISVVNLVLRTDFVW
jgi:hypothetical protein